MTYADEANTLYEFEDKRVVVKTGGQTSADLRYVTDDAQSPGHLDMTWHSEEGEQVSPMIYQIDGNVLSICYSPPGASRPDGLIAASGSPNTLIVLSRHDTP